MTREELSPAAAIERTENDLVLAISSGRADVGLGIEAAARQYRLGFVPLVDERFDLLVWRKAYFDRECRASRHHGGREHGGRSGPSPAVQLLS